MIDIACSLAEHDAIGSIRVRTARLTMAELFAYRERLARFGLTLTLDDAGVVIQPVPRPRDPDGTGAVGSLLRRLLARGSKA